MIYLDNTQELLTLYLRTTEKIMNELLDRNPYYGKAKILPNIDLGFPHDVIRLAGGFATGVYVSWNSNFPFVPVDICMNACTVSFYELSNDNPTFFSQKTILNLLSKLENSSYKANFHRGNHFISYVESISDRKRYIMIHSSAIEFETDYNGLYPVEGNFFYDKLKTYYAHGRYIRYLNGKAAELYLNLASNLYLFNENRHDFIIASLLDDLNCIAEAVHYHHYGMPSSQEALLGSHILHKGEVSPLLTRPGENVYLIKYDNILSQELSIGNRFITPHGLGKHHVRNTEIYVDAKEKLMSLDNFKYKIQYGESLRSHPGLELRNIELSSYFNYFSKIYKYTVVNEFRQLASFNKSGFIQWTHIIGNDKEK